VILPAALIVAVRRRGLRSFVVGAAVVIVPLWLPVLIRQWHSFVHHVIDYSGPRVVHGPWGWVNLAWNLEHDHLAPWLVVHGRLIPLLVSAALAALLVVRTNHKMDCPGIARSAPATPPTSETSERSPGSAFCSLSRLAASGCLPATANRQEVASPPNADRHDFHVTSERFWINLHAHYDLEVERELPVLERVGRHALGDSGAHRRGRLTGRLSLGLVPEAGEEFLRET
jgi:hypothetical protein